LYKWYVPAGAVISDQYWVRLVDNTNSIYATSDGTFEISPNPGVHMIAPDGGENWPVGSTQNILWSTTGPGIGNVKLEYSINGGTAWKSITESTLNNGSYPWVISQNNSEKALVKVSVIPSIEILSPKQSDILETQTPWNILWQSIGVDFVNLEYSSNGGNSWIPINSSPVSALSGTYTWVVPEDTSASGQAVIRIKDVNS
jgi:hypothetical protein